MPRKVYLANYLSSSELKQRYKKTVEPVESVKVAFIVESIMRLDSEK
ncbi:MULTISPECIES: hypothetical protein [Okeania]|nr:MULTISPECIES: hypothetical protein [Okeania]NET16980.1 hypothetical protein [Okeania sp. SIO1H6]NES77498.1 hypothetical protein [Okeania sp. SIO1H4]NET18568.1 hypothetical protein [Okeania sp. SIO1H5]NET78319.1 hypothetical protein [Okeania sp. SIO1F9]NET92615.1 hypothetical protein [Okeania sp. SIO1H2]